MGEGEPLPPYENFLHQRRAHRDHVYERSGTGPGIGFGDLPVVHFMINWRDHCVL